MKKILPLIVLSVVTLAGCNTKTELSQLNIEDPTSISSQRRAITAGSDAIKLFGDSYAKLKDFTGMVSIADAKDGNQSNAVVGDSKFFFKKDRNERVEITKSNDAQKQGTLISYRGGDKVQVLLAKAIPFLGKKFTLPVNDKRLATSRGLAFDQLDLTAMLNRFNKAGVTIDLLPSSDPNFTKVSGKGTFKGLDSEVTEEILTIDNTTMLPKEDVVMVKNKTVLKISVSDLKLNVGLTDDIFNLPDGK